MIRLSSARRREEEFARLIEGSRADSPLTAPTSDLVELTRSLRALPLTSRGPDPRFRADLRSRLLDEPGPATAVPARAHRARSPQRRTALRVATAAVLGVGLGVTGTASASQGALPGEPLYLVKRGVESVQLTLTPNPVDKGKLHLQHAERRSSEVEALLQRGAAERPASLALVESTLEALESDTRRGSELLLTPGGAADPTALTTLRSFVDGEQAWLDRLEPALPQDLQPDVDPLADLLTVLDEEVEDRAVGTPAPATSTPASPASPASPAVTGGSPPRVERPASVPAPAPLITSIPASPTDRRSSEAVLPADRPSRATPSSPSATPTPARSAGPSATSTAPRSNAPKTSEPSVRAEPSETSEPSARPSPARSSGAASSSAARTSPGTSSARRSLAPAGSGAPSEPTSGVRPTASAARSTTTGSTPSGSRTSSPPPGSSTAETQATASATRTTSASAR